MCKINQLHRDLPLLVIHRHHHVVFAADRTHEDGFWIIRPVYEYPGRSSRFDCGNDSFGILNSKQAISPAWGLMPHMAMRGCSHPRSLIASIPTSNGRSGAQSLRSFVDTEQHCRCGCWLKAGTSVIAVVLRSETLSWTRHDIPRRANCAPVSHAPLKSSANIMHSIFACSAVTDMPEACDLANHTGLLRTILKVKA